MIPRAYQPLKKYVKRGEVLVIYGSRRVGKTTLLNRFLSKTNLRCRVDTGDNIKIQRVLGSQDLDKIKDYVGDYQLVAIDEAQHIPNIGIASKLIVDNLPRTRVILTGSSSFTLSGQVGEPLTGRKRTLTLFPLAQLELAETMSRYDLKQNLSTWLIYGSYPAVETAKRKKEKLRLLEEIVNSYLLMDILELEKVKGAKVLIDLLRLLAFQIGEEVSLSELGSSLGIDYKTVARYLDLLEKTFVIYNLRGYSRNLRKEVTKKSKYYFFDNGIRNAIVSNFNDLELRDDVGQLWENFMVSERIKRQTYFGEHSNNYFWRTWEGKELDWVEERDGRLFGYEFKYTKKKPKLPAEFVEVYPKAKMKIVDSGNYLPFIGVK